MVTLLLPDEVDVLLRYRRGRARRLARKGLLPFIKLPDGDIRFDEDVIRRVASGELLLAIPPTEGVSDGK